MFFVLSQQLVGVGQQITACSKKAEEEEEESADADAKRADADAERGQ